MSKLTKVMFWILAILTNTAWLLVFVLTGCYYNTWNYLEYVFIMTGLIVLFNINAFVIYLNFQD